MPRKDTKEETAEAESIMGAIEDTDLRYPGAPLLCAFIEEAKRPVVAARYVKRRMDAGEIHLVVSDWAYIIECITDKGTLPEPPSKGQKEIILERDHGECCITGYKGTLCDPLVVPPVLKVPTGWRAGLDKKDKKVEDRITPMLFAFFGRTYAKYWLTWAMGSEVASRVSGIAAPNSHWLVRKSAAEAFARGMIRLDSIKHSRVQYKINNQQLLGTERKVDENFSSAPVFGGRVFYCRVDPRFFDTHARLSLSIRYVEIAKGIAPEILQEGGVSKLSFPLVDIGHEQPLPLLAGEPRQKPSVVTSLLTKALLAPWLALPAKFRATVYELARNLGIKFDSKYRHRSWNWQGLPFGLHLQFHSWDTDGLENEFNALRLVRQYTTIPVGEPLDFIPGPEVNKRWGFVCPSPKHSLITHLPGHELYKCIDLMSEGHIHEIAVQLRDYVSQLRTIPRSVDPQMAICDSLGKPVRHNRLRNAKSTKITNKGPFQSEKEFNQAFLQFPDDPSRQGHKFVFSHGNLNPKSILVDRYVRPDGTKGWKITGIVNWRSAGWYPEYWELTNSLYEKETYRHSYLMRTAFKGVGDYAKELKLERRSWEVDKEENHQYYLQRKKECNIHNRKIRQEYLASLKKNEAREDGDEDEAKEKEVEKRTGDEESEDEAVGLHVVVGPY